MALLVLVLGCRKDPPQPGGTGLTSHIQVSADSACVLTGNTITPNGDGVNDRFLVWTKHIVEISVHIRNSQGEEVFATDSFNTAWDGTDSSGTGPYTVYVAARTSSQVQLNGQCRLYVLDYGSEGCLHHPGTPVCGDQLDPRLCGIAQPTNEVFCP